VQTASRFLTDPREIQETRDVIGRNRTLTAVPEPGSLTLAGLAHLVVGAVKATEGL